MKFLSRISYLILFLIVLAGFGGYVFYARLPDITAKHLSKKLKVPVEIGDISLSLSSIEIDNLEIANLPTKKLQKAFSSEMIVIKAPLKNYTEKTILIDQITVDHIYLGLEFDSASGTSGNWTILMNNLSNSAKKDENTDTVVIIKELILTNIQVEVYYDKEGGSVKKFPIVDKIVLTNINSKAGLPTEQILRSVLGQMLQSVFLQENIKNMLKDSLDSANPLNSMLSPFKGLFE